MFSRPTGVPFLDRIIGTAKLDVATYEAIKDDPEALGQAALVVLVTGVATNVWVAAFAPDGVVRALGGMVLAFLAWLLFAALVWWLGRWRFAPEWAPPEIGQLLRLTGYATTPNLLNLFGFVPIVGWLVLMLAAVWSLVTAYTAVRVGLATSEGRALAATFMAYLANSLLYALAANVLGVGRGGGFLPLP